MAQVFFYNPQGFEPWDWRNPSTQGIGGSETCHIEMAERLAKRGHRVISFAPVPEPSFHARVEWRHYRSADTTAPGLWILFRSPQTADLFEPRTDQVLWHVCQDVHYFAVEDGRPVPTITPDRGAKFRRFLALSPPHQEFLERHYPFLQGKVSLSSNGICSDRLPPPSLRDPFRLIWASSPDRGLEALLHIFRRAREYEPRLQLRVAYGFDNWDKVIAKNPGGVQDRMKKRILSLFSPGVQWLGRLPQPDLWNEFGQAGIWCYPTTFEETSCIACMEAQALGAIPITHRYWAVGHNVRYGFFIAGDPLNDALTRARYVGRVVALARDPALQERIRQPMMDWARAHFDWEHVVDQWQQWILEDGVA